MKHSTTIGRGLIAMAACLGGRAPKPKSTADSIPPAIPISQPVVQEVTDYVDFTGRTDAKESVNVVARVTGYLVATPFKEGAEIKKGDTLFEIDPHPYQAQYDQAVSQVVLNQARVKEAKADNARARELARTPGAISQQDLDRYQAAEEEAQASVQAANASLEIYRINLGYCKVTSPIDGQVSRYFMTPGNLVNQDQTQLTTVVSLDPMYVYFDLDETTLVSVRRAINTGRIQRYQQGAIPVFIGIGGEDGFPIKGTINFINNQVNSGTASITVRGEVENSKPEDGARVLSPGMFVRVRLPIGKPHSALLVIDRALGSDQDLKFVYVAGANNTIEQRRVETGALQDNGLRVIESGLKPTDWVVVGGVQQVRPRMQIRPDQVTMPTLGAAVDSVSPSGKASPDQQGSPTPSDGSGTSGSSASGSSPGSSAPAGGVRRSGGAAPSGGAPSPGAASQPEGATGGENGPRAGGASRRSGGSANESPSR